MIFIADGQTDQILDHIKFEHILENDHEKSKENWLETFPFTVFADQPYAEHLTKRNKVLIPGEDGELVEFTLFETIKLRRNERLTVECYARASYLDLKKNKSIDVGTTSANSAELHLTNALSNTRHEVGQVAFKGVRTFTFDDAVNPFQYIKKIAQEFELEPIFRVEHAGGLITHRYVDLVDRVGAWRGRMAEFGKDLESIERKESTENVVTALRCFAPADQEGNRVMVEVTDEEALQRWGINGQHLWDDYYPESENQAMTEEELEGYGRTELNKRINATVTYKSNIVDLEHVPGLENKKIRFGDTIRIKDTKFNPPLYLEARVFKFNRDIKNKARKEVELGDFVEYTEEEVNNIWQSLQRQVAAKVSLSELQDYAYDKQTTDSKDSAIRSDVESYANTVSSQAKDEAITYTNNTVEPIQTSVSGLENDVDTLQVDLDDAEIRLLDAESNITQAQNQISLKVDADYVTGAIDDIEIGGRNLITGTKDWSTGWFGTGDFSITNNTYKGLYIQEQYSSWQYKRHEPYAFDDGKTYTGSVYLKTNNSNNNIDPFITVSNNTSGGAYLRGVQDEQGRTTVSTEWKRFHVTFTFNGEGVSEEPTSLRLEAGGINTNNNDILYIAGLKIEEGNKVTDWTPAPEDVQSEINTVYTDLTTEINVLSDQIELKADATVVSDVEARVSKTEVDIDGLENQITLKADSTTVDDIENRVSSAEIDINGLEGEINLKVSESGVIAAINLSSEGTTIQSDKINLVGAVNVLSDITGDLGIINAGTINGVNINGSTFNSITDSRNYTTIENNHIHSEGDYWDDQFGNVYGIFDVENGAITMKTAQINADGSRRPVDVIASIRASGISVTNSTGAGTFIGNGGDIGFGDWFDGNNRTASIYAEGGNLALDSDGAVIIKSGFVIEGDPYEQDGAMYYDQTTNRIRTRQDGYWSNINDLHRWDVNGNSEGFVQAGVFNGGWSGINGTSGSYYIAYEGNTGWYKLRAGAADSTSLATLKTDIEPIKISALEKIKNTELYQWRWKDRTPDDTGNIDDALHYGPVIGDGYKMPTEILAPNGEALDHYPMITFAWGAIQELSDKQEEQADLINYLSMENQVLKQKVAHLEEEL